MLRETQKYHWSANQITIMEGMKKIQCAKKRLHYYEDKQAFRNVGYQEMLFSNIIFAES